MQCLRSVRAPLLVALSLPAISGACARDVSSIGPPAGIARGAIVWSAAPGGAMRPVVAGDLVVSVTEDHRVQAFDRVSGTLRWTTTLAAPGNLGRPYGFGMAVAADIVVVPDGYLFGVDRLSGALRWTFQPSGGAAPGLSLIASDGAVVYAGSSQGRVFAVDGATGVAKWDITVTTDPNVAAFDPIVFRDTVYVGLWSRGVPARGGLMALDARDGRQLWYTAFPVSSPERSSNCGGAAAVVGDLVVASSEEGRIFALERATGAVRWMAPRLPIASVNDQRFVAATRDIVVAGSTTPILVGYDAASGVERWRVSTYGSPDFWPVADDSSIFAWLSSGQLLALDASSGAQRWVFGDRGPVNPDGSRQWKARLPPAVLDDLVFIPGVERLFAVRR